MVFFLQPGHTHEDIDQMFSILFEFLRTHTVGSMEELITGLVKAWRKKPHSRPLLEAMLAKMNWCGFLAPHLIDFTGHQSSFAMLFRKTAAGFVGMKLKTLYQSPLWQGSGDHPDDWIKMFSSEPEGFPEVATPTPVDLATIVDLLNFNKHLSAEAVTWLTAVKTRGMLFPEVKLPIDFQDIAQFKLKATVERLVDLQQLVGNGPESFKITNSNSVHHVEAGKVPLQKASFQLVT